MRDEGQNDVIESFYIGFLGPIIFFIQISGDLILFYKKMSVFMSWRNFARTFNTIKETEFVIFSNAERIMINGVTFTRDMISSGVEGVNTTRDMISSGLEATQEMYSRGKDQTEQVLIVIFDGTKIALYGGVQQAINTFDIPRVVNIDPDIVNTWNLESLEDQVFQAFQAIQDRVEQGRDTVTINISIISSDIKNLAEEKEIDIEEYLESSVMFTSVSRYTGIINVVMPQRITKSVYETARKNLAFGLAAYQFFIGRSSYKEQNIVPTITEEINTTEEEVKVEEVIQKYGVKEEKVEVSNHAEMSEVLKGKEIHDSKVVEGKEIHDSKVVEGKEIHDSKVVEGKEIHDSKVVEGKEIHDSKFVEGKEIYDSKVVEGKEIHDSKFVEGKEILDGKVVNGKEIQFEVTKILKSESSPQRHYLSKVNKVAVNPSPKFINEVMEEINAMEISPVDNSKMNGIGKRSESTKDNSNVSNISSKKENIESKDRNPISAEKQIKSTNNNSPIKALRLNDEENLVEDLVVTKYIGRNKDFKPRIPPKPLVTNVKLLRGVNLERTGSIPKEPITSSTYISKEPSTSSTIISKEPSTSSKALSKEPSTPPTSSLKEYQMNKYKSEIRLSPNQLLASEARHISGEKQEEKLNGADDIELLPKSSKNKQPNKVRIQLNSSPYSVPERRSSWNDSPVSRLTRKISRHKKQSTSEPIPVPEHPTNTKK